MEGNRSIHQRIYDYSHKEIAELYKDFHISAHGYHKKQVEYSREHYGSNTIARRGYDTIFHRLRRSFINPFTIILFFLAIISFVTDVLLASNFSRNMTTVLIITSMLLMSGIIRFSQEIKSKRATDRILNLLHSETMVLRDGTWIPVSSSELVTGDTIRFTAGERIPADIRLIETKNLFLSQGIITGESAVLEKNCDPILKKGNLSYEDYTNIAFMGSAIIGGTGKGIVVAVGRDTVYGSFNAVKSDYKNKFDQGANSISWVLIHFMMILIPIVFISCGLTKGNWLSAFLFALSVAVGLTPEMLPMVINACLAKGNVSMSKKETIVKNINAMQGFGSMDILCVDKTGTLTGDSMSLEYYMDILGNESHKVLDFACLNSFYQTSLHNHIDLAILRFLEIPDYHSHFSVLTKDNIKLDELPFDHERKSTGVLVKSDTDNLLIVKGNVEDVFRRCSYVEYKGKRNHIEPSDLTSVHAIVDEMLDDGMKVLAVAYKSLNKNNITADDEKDLTLLGYLAFFDAPKSSAADAIKKLHAQHISVRVLTGDHKSVAFSICNRLKIDTTHILTGEELETLSEDDKLIQIEKTTVFAQLSPKQKTEIVQMLQTNGHTVGFLGDGMNDLPAIAEADVGISVDTAAEAVKESADVILLKKDLNVLEEGVMEGRKAFSNMIKYIKITASSNFGNIFSIVIASIFLPFFPITSIQLLLLNLLYDTLCLVLPWDNVDKDMCLKPLEWSGRTLGRFMRFFGPISSIFDLLTFAFLFFVLCPTICGGSFMSLTDTASKVKFIAIFQTGWFLESMWSQILILHLLRTPKLSIFQSKPSRPVILVTTCGSLFFTILTFTPFGGLIGLTALPLSYFYFLICIVLLYLLLVTFAKKWYVRKYHELL